MAVCVFCPDTAKTMSDPVALGLPHREPFIFVDEVVVLNPGEAAEACKTFPISTPFFAGHFPDRPMVPGVILAEALAQTAGLAAGQSGKSFLLSAIRFMRGDASGFSRLTRRLKSVSFQHLLMTSRTRKIITCFLQVARQLR